MREHDLKVTDYEMDEIVNIEFIGDEDTIDITVDDTHMFYGNDIYTHNSAISAQVLDGTNMGGSIKKGQIGHFIVGVAKTPEQKLNGTATLSIIKSRFGRDGIIFEDCVFDNGTLNIDTRTTNGISVSKNRENAIKNASDFLSKKL